jgi:uncharacterized membrane protein YkoI
MTNRKLTLTTAITAAMLAASPLAIANPSVPATDMKAAQAIKQANISMQYAITQAERYTAGKAIGARFAEHAQTLAYMIDLVDPQGDVKVVRVTAGTGEVTGVWPKAEYPGDTTRHREP